MCCKLRTCPNWFKAQSTASCKTVRNSLIAITKFVEGITWDHMSTDESHRRVWFCTLLPQYRTCKHRMVSALLPQVNLNLQQDKWHQMILLSASAYPVGLLPCPAMFSNILAVCSISLCKSLSKIIYICSMNLHRVTNTTSYKTLTQVHDNLRNRPDDDSVSKNLLHVQMTNPAPCLEHEYALRNYFIILYCNL
jgi:hypothetical protein